MRILQLVQRPQRRGAEIFAFEVSRQLEKYGCEVRTLYLYHYDGQTPLSVGPKDVLLEGNRGALQERLFGAHPVVLSRLMNAIERFDPDIIQLNGGRSVKYGTVAKLIMRAKLRGRLVYRVIDVPSAWNRKSWVQRIYRKILIPQVDGVIAVSSVSLDDAVRLYDVRCPSQVILNGIDSEKLRTNRSRSDVRAAYGAYDSDIVLLFLNSLVAQKRPDRFLRILGEVRKRQPCAIGWVVGDGPLGDKVRLLASEIGLDGACRFFGYQTDVASFINGADIVTMTSRTEGLPAVVLEAGFLGRPVVGTRVGGMSEAVIDGETGILVKENDTTEMVDALCHLIDNHALRIRLGEAAMERVKSNFTIEKIGAQYLSFFEQLILN